MSDLLLCSQTSVVTLANYLVCTGLPDHKYLALLITPLQTYRKQLQRPNVSDVMCVQYYPVAGKFDGKLRFGGWSQNCQIN